MISAPPLRTSASRVLALGIAGACVATLVLVLGAHAVRVAPAPERGTRAPAATQSSVGLRALLTAGDGQAYAAIARDPTLARPLLLASKPEFAYRAQRPLFGEVAWVASLGHSGSVPLTLAVLSVLAAGLAVMALAVLLGRYGLQPPIALGLFAVPTVLGIIWGMTPELLELAFITAGVLAWTACPRRLAIAVLAFTLAALTRESMLLVPFTMGVFELVAQRSRPARRDIGALVIPFVAYAGWVAVVRARVGFWPFAARSNRLTLIPFAGLVHSVQRSSNRGTAVAWVLVGLVVVIVALVLGRRDEWYALVVAFLLMAPFLGADVWKRPADFGRVLLPLFVYSIVLVLDALKRRTRRVVLNA
jgi:hypothetical protein